MKKPIELTKEFITDYQNWNDFAYNLSETEDDESDHKIEKKYDDLILKYYSAEKNTREFHTEVTHRIVRSKNK
ncbi:hypothetical protein MQE36_05690 [Zhouia spongiae]|uniref:Uncharacterized protein n=1 Tax=Zhouia spongiae TaxID=2202721 RepID=A0ABY3YPW5_9FLAO|nr:hypothetical protein [Zhouia spongiae]UNY99837.1 hypothetical protein MQE36_05690 [Zhouia spongiae]